MVAGIVDGILPFDLLVGMYALIFNQGRAFRQEDRADKEGVDGRSAIF